MKKQIEALAQLINAKTFSELLLGGEDVDHAFHRLAKLCHPDRHPGDATAAKAFIKLTTLRDAISKPKKSAVVIDRWADFEPFARGDIADLYLTRDDKDETSVFKIARSKTDNDLIERESAVLKKLHAAKKGPQLANYMPELRQSLLASGRRANVMNYAEGFVSLEEIVRRSKRGVEFRHIVWMMNRLLSCLGYVHHHGVVHAAVLPSHVLYNLKNHDMRLVDWCYSVDAGQRVVAVVSKYKALYAPEILAKKPAHSFADLYMAARIMQFASARAIPRTFQSLFDWCLAEQSAARPSDAWAFQDMWRERAKQEFGEPKFVELTLPVN